jgi:hypothetical protein
MNRFKNIHELIYKNKYHILSILLIFTSYFFSLIIFKEVIVASHDNLDNQIPINHIISNIFRGNFNSATYMLSGEIKWFYIENILYPINIFRIFLDDKLFYFTEDVFKKLLAYFTFFILSKSLIKNKFESAICAVFFSTIINAGNPYGYGIVMMPYFLYLLIFKKELKTKHLLIILFTGLNSSLVQDYLALCALVPLSFLLKKTQINFKLIIVFFLTLTISLAISAIPVMLNLFLSENIHRQDFIFNKPIFNLSSYLAAFIGISSLNFYSLFFLPKKILFFFIITSSLILRDKNLLLLMFFLIFIYILSIVFNPYLTQNIFKEYFTFLSGFNFNRVDRIMPFIFSLILIFNFNAMKSKRIKKIIYFSSVFVILSIQLSIPSIEASKVFLKNNFKTEKFIELKKQNYSTNSFFKAYKFISNKTNYRSSGLVFKFNSDKSFDDYYKFSEYNSIKSIVKENRVLSVGVDPMIAIMNDIKVIDGYHTNYPKNYKIKFRKVIAKELSKNDIHRKYYDNWGSRVYAFYSDKENLLIDFNEAKNIGASYVLSSFVIKNKSLKLVKKLENMFIYIIL